MTVTPDPLPEADADTPEVRPQRGGVSSDEPAEGADDRPGPRDGSPKG